MSVLLSIIIYYLFSLCYGRYDALQVSSFGDIQQDGMVFGLASDLDQAEGAVGVEGGGGQHFQEI